MKNVTTQQIVKVLKRDSEYVDRVGKVTLVTPSGHARVQFDNGDTAIFDPKHLADPYE